MNFNFDLNYFVLAVLTFSFAICLVLREFWCWYFKFSQMQKELTEIRRLLEKLTTSKS